MKANKKVYKNLHEFLIEDKTFEKESKELLSEIEVKTSENKIKTETKNILLKLIKYLLSFEFIKSISSKIPNPKDFNSKEDFVNNSLEIISKEFIEHEKKY